MTGMRCPTLKELSPPPPGKIGWPWTEESPQLLNTMPDGLSRPKISIVTPNLNQCSFLEETIRSVLLQGYPDLEYIIIDGGSTDGSVEIIKKYDKWLKYWVSEPDRGQSHALNKGFTKATGRIHAYLNSNDLYNSGAFHVIGHHFSQENTVQLVVGECICFDQNGLVDIFRPRWPKNLHHFLQPFSSTFAQPAAFWSGRIFQKVGGFDEDFNFCFDQEFYLRLGLSGIRPILISNRVASYREHTDSKTRSQRVQFYLETIKLVHNHANALNLSTKQKELILKRINGELDYVKVFHIWEKRGRSAGLTAALSNILKHPNEILKRRTLGLLKRLFLYRYQKVKELQNI
jgi:glycosyltransferase involved in cell wall biosynthesis